MRILLRAALFLILAMEIPAQTKELIVYFPEWKMEDSSYFIKEIETRGAADKITCLEYAFCEPRPDAAGIVHPEFMNPYAAYGQAYSADMSIDGIADDPQQKLKGHFNQIKKLKVRHPQIRTLISVGGWGGSNYISDALLTPESRERFADELVSIYIKGNLPALDTLGIAGGEGAAAGVFDGIDIDWEYPISGGNIGIHNNPKDNDNLSEFYTLLRKKLDEVRPGLLITAAVPAGKKGLVKYNLKQDLKNVDWYNVMTYDYVGGWDKITGHHTPLYSYMGTDGKPKESMDSSVKFILDTLGLPADRIVPGVAFYGRGWYTQDTVNKGLLRPGSNEGIPEEGGYGNYANLMKMRDSGFEYIWDKTAMAPYMFRSSDRMFWTLEDERSAALKAEYVKDHNLRGVVVWEISGDDNKSTMINALYNNLR